MAKIIFGLSLHLNYIFYLFCFTKFDKILVFVSFSKIESMKIAINNITVCLVKIV